MIARKLLDAIYGFLTRKEVYHSMFWASLYGGLCYSGYTNGHPDGRVGALLAHEAVSLVFYMVLVYFNLWVLIPRYLADRAGVYFLLLIASCLLITPIKAMAFLLLTGHNHVVWNELRENQVEIFVAFLVIAFLSTLLRVLTDWWRHQKDIHEIETRSMQSELRFLRSQINPHFLFNTLNNLYALTLKKSDQAPEIVLKLSEIMRYMLYECNEREVLLANEVQYIRNYLDLERIRLPKGAVVEFEVEGVLTDQKIAPLLFVPFLENSFKHGINHALGGSGFVRANLKVMPGAVEFRIQNNKTSGPTEHPRVRSGGIGLANVRQRLAILYPGRHILKTEGHSDRFEVFLRVEL